MAEASVTAPPLDREFALAQDKIAGARREAGFNDWANAGKHAEAGRDLLASIGERLARHHGAWTMGTAGRARLE
ncbi:MAG: hypothetical protein HY674_10155 [Chloroflexi bacterium]|nr:hypothetical protein [Chloroflexota bacterium]